VTFSFNVSSSWKYKSDELLPNSIYDLFEDVVLGFQQLVSKKYMLVFDLSPEFLKDCFDFIKLYQFKPSHMTLIENHNVPNKKDFPYAMPKMLPEIPLIIAKVSSYYIKCGSPINLFKICYGTRAGIPNAIVTGLNPNCHVDNLEKMCANKKNMDGVPQKYLYSAIYAMMKEAGWDKVQKIVMTPPKAELLIDLIKQYDTATGLVPFKDVVTMVRMPDGKVFFKDKCPSKKKFLAVELCDLITTVLDAVWEDAQKGKVWSKIFDGAAVCYSSLKWEMLNAFFDCDGYDELVKMAKKTRVFFIEAAHQFFLSYFTFASLFAYLNHDGYEIGTPLPRGGMNDIFESLACGTEGYPCNERLRNIYGVYPFLQERRYWDGDFQKYDQTLLHGVLSTVGMFYATWYNYDGQSGDFAKSVVGDAVFRLAYKFLYLVPIEKLYYVLGMMFSGKGETTHANTTTQKLIFYAYLMYKLETFKDHKDIELLKLCINEGLIRGKFSGDDNAGGYPYICELLFNICPADYKIWTEKFGLSYKILNQQALTGANYFYKKGDIWIEDVSKRVESMTFLRNHVNDIYESSDGGLNYICVGRYVYRDSKDLLFRIGNSDLANSRIDAFFAKLLSLMYLAVGNIESYMILVRVFTMAKVVYNWTGILDFDRLKEYFRSHQQIVDIMEYLEDNYRGSSIIKPPQLVDIRNFYNRRIPKTKKPLVDFNTYVGFDVANVDARGFDEFM